MVARGSFPDSSNCSSMPVSLLPLPSSLVEQVVEQVEADKLRVEAQILAATAVQRHMLPSSSWGAAW